MTKKRKLDLADTTSHFLFAKGKRSPLSPKQFRNGELIQKGEDGRVHLVVKHGKTCYAQPIKLRPGFSDYK